MAKKRPEPILVEQKNSEVRQKSTSEYLSWNEEFAR